MANKKYRHLQLMRAANPASSPLAARTLLANNANNMLPGEMAIASYDDAKALNGTAIMVAIKDSKGKIFYIDHQRLLDTIGFVSKDGDNKLIFDEVRDLLGNVIISSGDTQTVLDAIASLADYSKGLMDKIAGSPAVLDIKQMIDVDGQYTSTAGDANVSGATTTSSDKYKITRNEVVTNPDGTKDIVTKEEALKLMYTSVSPVDLGMPKAFGDLKAGTKAKELNKYSLSEILDMMLFETIYPTYTNHTFSLKAYGTEELSNTKVIKPEAGHITYVRSKGSYTAAGSTTNMNYSGVLAGNPVFTYSFTPTPGYVGGNIGTAVSNQPVPASGVTCNGFGTYTFKATQSTALGAQEVHDSKSKYFHDDAKTKVKFVDNLRNQPCEVLNLSAASTFTNVLKYYVTTGSKEQNPTFTNNATNFSNGAKTFNIGPINSKSDNCIVIDTPKGTSVEIKAQDTAGKYTIGVSTVLKGTVTRTINGVRVTYNRFYTNEEANNDGQTVQITIKG